MNRSLAAFCTTTLLVGAAFAGAPANADSHLSLKPTAGRFSEDYSKALGAGSTATAKWTNKVSRTGSHSVFLEKAVETSSPSYAAAVVSGAEGMSVSDLGSVGLWVNGPCTGGSPRFNLHFDADGDGDYDGTGQYGCGNHVTDVESGWTRMTVADLSVDDNSRAVPSTATVLGLSVIVDEQGSYYVDDVEVAGTTMGEPND